MTEAELETYILPCHRKMYAAAAVIVSDVDEASDVVQEAFARLWERREDIPNPHNPEGYCLTVVKRMSIDRLRRRRHIEVNIDDVAVAADGGTDRRLEASDSLRRVNSLLRGLPANQQEVIRMSALGGMDNSEIAAATGLSDVNVRALLSRGRRMLKKMFERENN